VQRTALARVCRVKHPHHADQKQHRYPPTTQQQRAVRQSSLTRLPTPHATSPLPRASLTSTTPHATPNDVAQEQCNNRTSATRHHTSPQLSLAHPLARRTNRDDGNDFRQWHMDHRRTNTRCVNTHTPAGDGSTSNLTHCTQCASHSGEPQAAPINDRATPTPTQADIDQPVEPPQGLNGRGARTNVNTRRRDQTQAHTHPRSATLINAVHVHHHDTRIRTRPHNNANLQQHQSRDCATPTPTGVGR